MLGRFHAARTAPALWMSVPLNSQEQTVGYLPFPGCDLLSLCVQNYAFCAFLCGLELLRTSVALIAIVSGICSQFSKPAWRPLGM